jgi:ferredoxin
MTDYPVHAIMELGECRPDDASSPSADAPPEDPAAGLKVDENQAVWGSTR